jgi:hypothetical protein
MRNQKSKTKFIIKIFIINWLSNEGQAVASILPIIVISWLSFWLNREYAGARVGIGLSTLFAMGLLIVRTNVCFSNKIRNITKLYKIILK